MVVVAGVVVGTADVNDGIVSPVSRGSDPVSEVKNIGVVVSLAGRELSAAANGVVVSAADSKRELASETIFAVGFGRTMGELSAALNGDVDFRSPGLGLV